MILNVSTTKTMIVSRSRTMYPQSHPLTIGRTVLKESDDDIDILHSFPRWHLRSIFACFPEQLFKGLVSWGSLDKYLMIDCSFGDTFGVLSCLYWSIYWSAVWCSAANTLLKLLDCVVSGTNFVTGGVLVCDIAYYQTVVYDNEHFIILNFTYVEI